MYFNPNVWTQAEVQDIFDNAKAELVKVYKITQYNNGGTSIQKQAIVDLEKLLDACQRFFAEIDPTIPDLSTTDPYFIK